MERKIKLFFKCLKRGPYILHCTICSDDMSTFSNVRSQHEHLYVIKFLQETFKIALYNKKKTWSSLELLSLTEAYPPLQFNQFLEVLNKQKHLLWLAFTIQTRWLHQVCGKMLYSTILPVIDGTGVVLYTWGSCLFFISGVVNRSLSHIWGRCYLPMLLLMLGLLALIKMDFFMALVRLCPSVPTMLKSSTDVWWPVVEWWSYIGSHNTLLDYFNIAGSEGYNLTRAINESVFIRVNNASLNRNIGKYNLPHI